LRIPGGDAALSVRVTEDDIRRIVALVPDSWLAVEPRFADADAHRAAYVEFFCTRLAHRSAFVGEAQRAHAAGL
jgi:hypothetical protein